MKLIKSAILIIFLLVAVQVEGWCATKYLRNVGTTNWNVDASWGTNADGTGDTTFPTSADDVVINAVASTTVLTVNVNSECKSIDFTGFTGTFVLAGTSRFSFSGNLTLDPGATYSYTGSDFIYPSGAGTQTITSNNAILNISFANGTGTVSLSDNLNTGITKLNINLGTFLTNNNSITCGLFQSLDIGTRTITLGSSTINCSSLDFTGNRLTLTANTSTINCSGAFAGGGLTTYNTVNLTGTSAVKAITGTNTFANLSLTGHASSTGGYSINANQTVTGTFKIKGNSPTNIITFRSDSAGTERTVTDTSTPIRVYNATIKDINFASKPCFVDPNSTISTGCTNVYKTGITFNNILNTFNETNGQIFGGTFASP